MIIKIIKYSVLVFIFILFIPLFSLSQDIYRTQNGNILITTISADTVFTLSSKKVDIILTYSQSTFKITIDKSTFKSSNEDFNEELSSMKSDEIILTGKFDLENIDRKDHIPLDFDVEGIISSSNNVLRGKGRLEHISTEGNISCLLTLKFSVDKEDLGLFSDNLNLNDEVQLDIIQVLLNN